MPDSTAPKPAARTVRITQHGLKQATDRTITKNELIETVYHGRKVLQKYRGVKGGDVAKFYKTFVDRTSGTPINKRVVVVCETFPDRDVVLSAYLEQMKS